MPPRYLRKRSSTRLKPCAERMVETCDIAPADQCCGVIPCNLCLEWETYADGISYGSAEFATSSWAGTVGGHVFVSYWQRNESGECEYIVTLDGEEVYRATCYEGASCRDPQGEVEVSTAYLEGTLRWSKHEPRELELSVNPDTGCNDFFCGSCRCSCDCLCVTITEYGGHVITGEICDVAYPCDSPVWAGQIGYYDLSIALGRDDYGECIITPTVDGEELDPVAAPGCGSMAATITLADGTVIEVRCKQCSCEEPFTVCCDDRCNTVNDESCANPLPTELTCTLTVSSVKIDPITGLPVSCYTCTGTLYLSPIGQWIGVVIGSCSGWCGGSTRVFEYECTVECGLNPGGSITWFISIADNAGGTAGRVCTAPFSDPPVWAAFESSCDPILLTGQSTAFDCNDLTCVIPLLGIDETFGEVIFDVVVNEEP